MVVRIGNQEDSLSEDSDIAAVAEDVGLFEVTVEASGCDDSDGNATIMRGPSLERLFAFRLPGSRADQGRGVTGTFVDFFAVFLLGTASASSLRPSTR